jgi:hypothetical protein
VRVRRWKMPDDPLPAHPYRNSAIFHGVLAGMIILVAWATGGSPQNALYVAAGFFVLATGWSWTQWRRRLLLEKREEAARARRARPTGGRR